MDINFPLILTIAVLVCGIAWVLEKFKLVEKKWLESPSSIFPVLLAVLVLRSFVFEPFQIPSGSMIPTLRVGDFILVDKFSYGLRLPVTGTKVIDIDEPKRGDVMVFFPPNDDRYFIKRVIGLPGDTVEVKNGMLSVNGDQMQQTQHPLLAVTDPRYVVAMENLDGVVHSMQRRISPGRLSKSFYKVVPQGHYFMMGDNRDNSSDSRVWGTVPEENIVGKAVAVWMHWDKFFSLPSFELVGKIK
jgi:signal peptidase I